jgi:hypothetical protein
MAALLVYVLTWFVGCAQLPLCGQVVLPFTKCFEWNFEVSVASWVRKVLVFGQDNSVREKDWRCHKRGAHQDDRDRARQRQSFSRVRTLCFSNALYDQHPDYILILLCMFSQFIVLNWMFSDAFTIRQQFSSNPSKLRQRFAMFGILNIILMPFILPFMAIYFAFKHAEEFQTKRDYLGPRKWSPAALWRMREFNELPHVFERR